MDPEAKGSMITNSRPVYVKSLGFWNHRLISVRGAIPQNHLVTGFHVLPTEFSISRHCAAHVRQWRLEADNLRHHRRNEGSIGLNPSKLLRKLIEEENTARHRVARGVIAAHDK